MSAQRQRLLFITLEPVRSQMAGPAIRCLEIARQLADEFDITVASPAPSDLPPDFAAGIRLEARASRSKIYELASRSPVTFLQANVLKPYPAVASLDTSLAVDLYDPYLLSVLAQYGGDPVTASASYRLMHQILERHMLRADFSVCASERQRDYYIGRYCALGRLTPEMYRFDPSFRKLIDVVPFGLPETPPARSRPGMKGSVPGIDQSDFVLLWGGGIWQWFDPLTVIEAVARVSAGNPRVKLFFMGWKSPNPKVDVMPMALKARELARELAVLDRSVFFGEDWIAYEDRVNYLLDADAAVSAHFDLPETRFSFRTRILDYLWAGLPILTTCGDELADLIEAGGAGCSLPYQNVEAWVAALDDLLKNPDRGRRMRDGAKELARRFIWRDACEPLRQYCRSPHRLPAHKKIKMPSLVERMHAVYSRGGKDLVVRRSKEIIGEIIKP